MNAARKCGHMEVDSHMCTLGFKKIFVMQFDVAIACNCSI